MSLYEDCHLEEGFVAWCVISLYEDCHLEVGFYRMVCHIIVLKWSSRGRVLSHGVLYHCMKIVI